MTTWAQRFIKIVVVAPIIQNGDTMANITANIVAIELAARGEEVRDSIVDAFKKLNTDGVDNTLSLGGRPASYYATMSQLNTVKQNLIPDISLIEIYPQDWDNSEYSFEARFPSASYDIYIQPGPSSTIDQLSAIGSAGIIAASTSANVIKCVGTVPTINIQLMVSAVIKT